MDTLDASIVDMVMLDPDTEALSLMANTFPTKTRIKLLVYFVFEYFASDVHRNSR